MIKICKKLTQYLLKLYFRKKCRGKKNIEFIYRNRYKNKNKKELNFSILTILNKLNYKFLLY